MRWIVGRMAGGGAHRRRQPVPDLHSRHPAALQGPLATLAVLSFLINWNDFLWPVYVLFTPESLTLPPGLSVLQSAYTTNYAVIMAGGVVASIPVLVLFFVAQRYIIQGVSRSGLKG